MIVEQKMKVEHEGEAEDVLEGWRHIPGFDMAYVLYSGKEVYVVGLFGVNDEKLAKGQKRVGRIIVKEESCE